MAKLTKEETELFCTVVNAMGGYQATADYLTARTGIGVNAAEVWRAARGKGVSTKLFKILNPPRPRIRFCIECVDDAQRQRLRELCHNLSAADLIERLEDNLNG